MILSTGHSRTLKFNDMVNVKLTIHYITESLISISGRERKSEREREREYCS